MSEGHEREPEPARGLPSRLDPDAATAQARRGLKPPQPTPPDHDAGTPSAPVDPRRYRWMIGIFGLTLLIAASIYQFAKHGLGAPGVGPGRRLHFFVAPLATGARNLDANTNPRCDPAHPNPQGLNVCGRAPLVLAFFVTGSASCLREVDTLQALAPRYSREGVQFAAVAVRASRADTAKLVRAHRWTIPVAYDRDGAVGDIYGVEICPLLELAYRGGIVAERLIGERWTSRGALAARVRKLL